MTSYSCSQSNVMQLEASRMEKSPTQEVREVSRKCLIIKGTLHLKINRLCSSLCCKWSFQLRRNCLKLQLKRKKCIGFEVICPFNAPKASFYPSCLFHVATNVCLHEPAAFLLVSAPSSVRTWELQGSAEMQRIYC